MRCVKKIRPNANGTKKLKLEWGNKMIAVRYYRRGMRSIKTVELVVSNNRKREYRYKKLIHKKSL